MTKRQAPPLSVAVGDVIRGRYKTKRMTQKQLSERSGIPEVSLQKKIAGESPISVSELGVLSGAVDSTPQAVMVDAVELVGGMASLMSAVGPKNVIKFPGTEADTYTEPKAADEFDDRATEPDE